MSALRFGALQPGHDDGHRTPQHRAPSACPVCGEGLALTRLGCTACGTEIGGVFSTCEFCALDHDDLATLRVFLASRGNLREVERYLGVSYPTARLRFNQILLKLGLGDEGEPAPVPDSRSPEAQTYEREAPASNRDRILADVATGALSPDEAQRLLQQA